MKIEISLIDETNGTLSNYLDLCKDCVQKSYDYLKLDIVSEITYIFIGEEKMRELNSQYRGKDKSTDVLTFNSDEEGYLADIFISFDVAKRQSELYKHSIETELAYLFVHGFLHSLGYDHGEDDTECLMFDIQDKIVEGLCLK